MLLEVANLTVCYDKAVLINNLSMGVDEGELVSLVGPNGAGKRKSPVDPPKKKSPSRGKSPSEVNASIRPRPTTLSKKA